MDISGPRHGDRDKDSLGDPLRMALGVCQAQRDSPRSPANKPSIDLEVLAQALHVSDQVVGRVGRQIGLRVADRGRAATAAALVELDDAVGGRVEPASLARVASTAGPAVQQDRGLPRRVATDQPMDLLALPHIEHALSVGLAGRIATGPGQRGYGFLTALIKRRARSNSSGVRRVGLPNVNPSMPISMKSWRMSAACSGVAGWNMTRRSGGIRSITVFAWPSFSTSTTGEPMVRVMLAGSRPSSSQ